MLCRKAFIMNSKIYEYLLAIYEEQNISRAAARCYLSQPALSQQLKIYEEKLGFPIFERSRTSMTPTKQGELVLETARQIAAAEKELHDQLEMLKKNAIQNIHINIEFTMRNMFLRDIWSRVRKLYPDAKLTLISGDSENALQFLQNGSADLLIFMTKKAVPKPFIQLVFQEDHYVLAASHERYTEKDLQEKMKKRQGWTYESVYIRENFSLYPSFQQEAMKQIGLSECPNVYTTSTFQEAAHLCTTKGGLSVLPESLFRILTDAPLLLPLPNGFPVKGVVVFKEAQALNPLYSLIWKLLKEKYEALGA